MVFRHENFFSADKSVLLANSSGGMAESSSRASEGLRVRLRVPAVSFKKKTGRPSDLQQYDQQLLHYASLRKKPDVIAELLQKEHNLDPSFMTGAKVNRRLRYLKQNKLGRLPPTNGDISLLAHDSVKPTCNFIIYLFFIDYLSRARSGKLHCNKFK